MEGDTSVLALRKTAGTRRSQKPIEHESLLPASDKSASIINNAFKGQPGDNPGQLRATSSSPRKRRSDPVVEESPGKRLRSRFIESGNSVSSSQTPTAQNYGRLKRPSRKPELLGTKSVPKRRGTSLLEIPPDLPHNITSVPSPEISEPGIRTRKVHIVLNEGTAEGLALDETRADEDRADAPDTRDGPTERVPTEPNTPARRGRPRKIVSEQQVVKPKIPLPRGRPRKGGSKRRVTDPKTPLPRGRPRVQRAEESSPIQGATGGLDPKPDNAKAYGNQGLLLEQPTGSSQGPSEAIAVAAINAMGESQTMLPDRSKGPGTSEHPGDTAQNLSDKHSTSSESETGYIASDAQSNDEEDDLQDLLEQPERADESRTNAEDEDVHRESRTSPELFNQQHLWSRILEAARGIGRPGNNLNRKRKKIPVETQTFRNFTDRVKETSRCYQSLVVIDHAKRENVSTSIGQPRASGAGLRDEAEQSVEARLKAHLKRLRSEVDALCESDAGTKRAEMIKDIYAHAIPQMVFLLKHAFRARSPSYSVVDETRTLKEVIQVIGTTETLCGKARKWSVKADTELPIVKPTSKTIYPSLRALLKAFQRELDDRVEERKRVRSETEIPRMHLEKEALHRREREQTERKKEMWLQQVGARTLMLSGQAALYPSNSSSQQVPFRPPPQQVGKQDQWSTAQDDALVQMLMNETIAAQPRKMLIVLPCSTTHLMLII